MFEVSIQQQRLLRLQYPQRFTEQHFFTVKTFRTDRTNKAYGIGSYSTQFREVTVVLTVYDMCYAYFRCLCRKEVWLILLNLVLLAISFPSLTLVAESFQIHLPFLLLLPDLRSIP